MEPGKYIISALIINEKDWVSIDNAVEEIKTRFFPDVDPLYLELHAKEIVHRAKIFSKLSHEAKYRLLREVYELIGRSDCFIIAIIIDKDQVHDKGLDLELWGMRFLFERLNMALSQKNRALASSGKDPQYGMMFIDSVSPPMDKHLRHRIQQFYRDGTFYVTNEMLIEDPMFIRSEWIHMCQLSDHIAYCLKRVHLYPPTQSITDVNFHDYSHLIEPKFHRDESGRLVGCGIKYFPKIEG